MRKDENTKPIDAIIYERENDKDKGKVQNTQKSASYDKRERLKSTDDVVLSF